MVLVNDGDPLSSLTTWLNHRLANRQQFSKGGLLLSLNTELTVRLPLKALEMSLTQLPAVVLLRQCTNLPLCYVSVTE